MPCFEKLTCCECVNVCVQVRLRLTFFFCYECLGIFEYFIFFCQSLELMITSGIWALHWML